MLSIPILFPDATRADAWILGAFAGLFGAAIGSFLNVVIHRLPNRGWKSLGGRSHCPKCKSSIRWFDNIPIVAWLWLRARCRDCRMPIAIRYPAVELLCAALFLWAWAASGGGQYTGELIVVWLFLASLLALSVIDIDLRILPDELTKGWMVLGPVAVLLFPALARDHWIQEYLNTAIPNVRLRAVVCSLLGMAAGAGTIAVIRTLGTAWFSKSEDFEISNEENGRPIDSYLCSIPPRSPRRVALEWIEEGLVRVRRDGQWRILGKTDVSAKLKAGDLVRLKVVKEAMGFGDVKLQGAIGVFVGIEGTVGVLVIASFAGAILGTLNLLRLHALLKSRARRRGRRDTSRLWQVAKAAGGAVPFGPYLALGATVVLLHRHEWIEVAQRYWLR
jgi:prepilin signal peptidase PulO-like enzyme (type II secretory pathway)